MKWSETMIFPTSASTLKIKKNWIEIVFPMDKSSLPINGLFSVPKSLLGTVFSSGVDVKVLSVQLWQ